MPAAIQTSEDGRVNVGGVTAVATAYIVRPADTTAYDINDQVATTTTAATNSNLVFQVARVDGGSGVISSAVMIDSTAETTKLSADLLLFDQPVTNAADNAAAAITDAEMEHLLPNGVISFDGTASGNFKTGGANGAVSVGNINIPFVCIGTGVIYGVVVARNAYTPISAEKLTFRLGVLQD